MKKTVRITESQLKRVITESVKRIVEEFNSPLPSFAAKEVEPKHRLRKQWNDDYDAMVARNHARGEEWKDSFNKKANLTYGKSLKEGTSDSRIYEMWEELIATVGAETMLNCIYQWSSHDEISKWIGYFEEEGYIGDDY